MIPPFAGPALGNLMQIAWVTPDLDRSMAEFCEMYRIPRFHDMEVAFPAQVFGESGEMKLRIALVNIDAMQIELIQPIGGGIDRLYREVLPHDGSHANVLHHVCVKVRGTIDDWNDYVSKLTVNGPVAYSGDVGDDIRFVYTDQRPTMGIYLEHVWYSPGKEELITAATPTYRSC